MAEVNKREHWGTRIGLVLAMAGNAIGLGNFLRFPVQAANNGGSAFMIPYFISLLLLGIPLMWIEWGIGRYGGALGHGTAPGMFDALWKNRVAKYLGILSIFLPLVILIYYTYIASWTIGYSIASLMGLMPKAKDFLNTPATEIVVPYREFLSNFIGTAGDNTILSPKLATYIFFVITLVISMWILAKGISGGIEKLNNFAIPALFIMAIILFIRVLTLGEPVKPGQNPVTGLAVLWEPDLSGILNPKIWLAAAGQIFFTLSLGLGAIMTYASYLNKDDDIALNALSTASLNESAEVILGGTIAIVSAAVFFGPQSIKEIAGGAFQLGFISMPAIFSKMPWGEFFGFLWFLLLYFAALTSIVALSQPAIAFFEDELGWSRKKSVVVLAIAFFASAHIPIFLRGALDEMDFWAGTFGLVWLALFEVIIFFWIFGAENAWNEITRGAQIKIPRFFFYIMKYVTPLFLIVILVTWTYKELPNALRAGGPGVNVARAFMIALLLIHLVLVRMAWKRRKSA